MIIAVDFDGTLHTGEFPNIGSPAPYAIDYMQKLSNDGHYLIIWTCRCGDKLTEAINWLLSRGIPFDRINEHEPGNLAKYNTNSRKVYAHLYVDDRQVGGLPTWEEIYSYVCNKNKELQK
ncbi:hypothetical protein [Dysgonomonas sp. ZJ279]|uniref:hypothetical protein n=1 Tax=Dysgonomonas sp. ZJ279 TaxID=2709796 RepID=UPI0013EA5C66|nr:hypothetical protein [Dysgonomonas sp. ZJ279]